eukprot:TRINITY_DN2299_c0_g1_i1.p1 TRINITY_DN2299_c0_g1~~TRINITY_DN2299_c0_g1_i1.p1  ORF type:complete len:145 (-),score=18.74 TRINITY_DN2299_c0_g1_i1:63-497(-)
MEIEVHSDYGWVIVCAVVYCILNTWMGVQVGKARKKYKVTYPTMYAIESENKDAKLFNCVQRGHQNSLELMPVFFLLLLLGGIQHPVASAILGVFYSIGRYFYFRGYSSGVPENRISYVKYSMVALLGLMGCTLSFAWHLLFKS